MLLMLLAVLATPQAPALTPKESVELPERRILSLIPSRTGRYLVLGEAQQLEIRDGETLKSVQVLPGRWTAIGFDEDDRQLLVVGDEALLYDTKSWTPQSLGRLPDAVFAPKKPEDVKRPLKPLQAFVMPDLDFYYLTAEGGVALATIENKRIQSKSMTLTEHPEGPPSQILGLYEGGFFLALHGGRGALSAKSDVYTLVHAHQPLLMTIQDRLGVFVGGEGEVLYTTRTWAYVAKRVEGESTTPKNLCAAIDRSSGRVYIGDPGGLRTWTVAEFAKEFRYEQFKDAVKAVALSSPKSSLYTLDKVALRRWAIPP